nr:c-type cytochrome [Conchiformibius kuhniae]
MHSSQHKQKGSALFTAISGLVILVSVLFLLVKLATSGYFVADVADAGKEAVKTRIMPAGNIKMGDGTPPGQRTGEQVFNKVCIQCHGADKTVVYAPKLGNNGEWSSRIAKGFNTLVNNAVNGFKGQGDMPAKGGDKSLTDDEVARAVAYMVNQSGGSFTEPPVQAGEGAASDAASAPAAQTDAAAAQDIFQTSCAACHGATSAVPFAPKLGNKDDWAPRIKQGKDVLFKHAIEGFTNPKGGVMPAKGGAAQLSDEQVQAVVRYMVQEAGGKL